MEEMKRSKNRNVRSEAAKEQNGRSEIKIVFNSKAEVKRLLEMDHNSYQGLSVPYHRLDTANDVVESVVEWFGQSIIYT